jgi:hypothetical protein
MVSPPKHVGQGNQNFPSQQEASRHQEVAINQAAASSNIQVRPPLLATPMVSSRDPHLPMMNQRKRKNRRRNCRAMYQELQDLVLGSVHVRVRPDGQVHPFYDKVILRFLLP